jgi:small subunit ribosomal protein S3
MGQKVNPHGLRVGVINGWDSRWFAKDELVGDLLVEDHKIREYLKTNLYQAGIPKIEIERDSAKVRIFIHCAKPGMIVGKGGAEIEKLQETVSKMIGKPVAMSIVEVRSPDLNAQLVAENIAAQLEKRISHRRAMKMAMQRAMKLGAKGIKVNASGRLGGREIAGSEHYHEGTIPLQTLRADIDYGFAEAKTTAGRIGIKVWLYKGEVLTGGPRSTPVEAPRRDRRDRRDGDRKNDRRERRDGDRAPRRDGGRFGERKQFSAGPRGPQGRPYQRPAAEAPKTEGGAN